MIRMILAAVPLAGVLVACAVNEMPTASDGAALFARNCTVCHGADARGGPDAPDLTRIAARNDGTLPVARVLSQIDGYGRGRAGDAMPEFGALLRGDLVPIDVAGTLTPTPRPLAALLAYLDSIQRL